ncbi:hypothetical protein [Planctomicrobium sp. SH664]|uniref:hypothetical protein n=1 Tax=Planctomicrobium sp. SH664 TaxID=3448125 RepID=UPI003F5C68F8
MLFAGPVLLAVQIVSTEVISPWACTEGQFWVIDAITSGCLLITGFLTCLGFWPGGAGEETTDRPVPKPDRFWLAAGVVNFLSSVLIIIKWMAMILDNPCWR